MGYTGVSFYVDWALLEAKQGYFTAEGIFDIKPLFEAAGIAGLYLLARPGPYINAEVSGGGYPAQITNGGPVILLQPENEYSQSTDDIVFPDGAYFQAVEDQYRAAGITVPFISNDAHPQGYDAPGSGNGSVDIYGHDAYPLGFDCANPYTWPDGALPTDFGALHKQQSPSTPYSLVEFQGGSFDPWGGSSFNNCLALLNEQFQRVFYKNNFSFGVTLFNIYMTFGGTNWGNLGHPGGYTSYDYGAVIAEDRTIAREKYSEAKLEANFLKASSAYLTAVSGSYSNGTFVNTRSIATTQLMGAVTNFYVVRHAAYNSRVSTDYRLTVPTSQGNISIPRLSPTLTLNGRDSKIHVTDYDLGGKKYHSKTILVLYGGQNETHEAAFLSCIEYSVLEGAAPKSQRIDNNLVINWQVTFERKVIQVGHDLLLYLLASSIIVKAGYLMRTVSLRDRTPAFTGDINQTTTIEVIGGAPVGCSTLIFNGESLKAVRNSYGIITGVVAFKPPGFALPYLVDLEWRYIDSLPELLPSYDDSNWLDADLVTTSNPNNLSTPTSLYGSDYGFYTGNLIFRGHFTAIGTEETLMLRVRGGEAFGYSVFLDGDLLGSWPGNSTDADYNQTLDLPLFNEGQSAVITILLDTMGFDENQEVGNDEMKAPRGILDYALCGRDQSAVSWKVTGNLGGEDYRDVARGPLNEGGLYAERQGYHLPNPPSTYWQIGKPTDGMNSAGVGFYTTNFNLSLPVGYDIPLSFLFTNSSTNGSALSNYRAQLYINGYQFGKYVNNIGPQTSFPVPEGILNHHGINYLALSLWALDAEGAKITDIELVAGAVIQSGYGPVELSPMPPYKPRVGAY
ncbi:MAG: hypothetical protein Q9167_005822 [Letrouitia subvulpina]